MSIWPASPVATITVENTEGGDRLRIGWTQGISNFQSFPDLQVGWIFRVIYSDHPLLDHGRGYFRARIFRASDSGSWDPVDSDEKTLGNDNDDGNWSDWLILNSTIVREIEPFRIDLHCELQDTEGIFGGDDSLDATAVFTAMQGSVFIGNCSLDYLPVSIVYCPPNQDMSASLTQATQYGTRITIGTSEGFQAQATAGVEFDALGMKVGGVNTTESRSMTNRSETGIELSYFRSTVLTADNQRAIGRAYWGPLGDIFVIAVKPRFAVYRHADGTLLYASTGADDIVVAPAYKLLRPEHDPIVIQIPARVRQRLLQLDPFLTNLNLFFPDSGAPLSLAANSYADPSANNRAERLGRWALDNATELNYSIGEAKELTTGESTEMQFQSTVTVEVGFGANLFGIIGIGGRVGNSFTTVVGLQSSKETMNRLSTTAACYLIRNQNERDLDEIEIFYDKAFSTLMFRKVKADTPCIMGNVKDVNGAYLAKVAVTMTASDGSLSTTTTDMSGSYCFPAPRPDVYTVKVGTASQTVTFEMHDEQPMSSMRVDFTGVRRVIDLQYSSQWEVALALGLSSEGMWRLSKNLNSVFDEVDLAYASGSSLHHISTVISDLEVKWPRTPLDRLQNVSNRQVENLSRIGVSTLQELWRSVTIDRQSEAIADKSGVRREELHALVDAASATRASVILAGQGPVKTPTRYRRWLAKVPFVPLRRRLLFRTSKLASRLARREHEKPNSKL
jgi:Carboxypeptidase regulatory-like domain